MVAVEALPLTAARGYAEVLGVLELAPWSGQPLREDNLEANILTLPFGPDDAGLVTYMILEHLRRVDVLQVAWVGS